MIVSAEIERAGYAGEISILRNIQLRINPGEAILITGPSGSGKSTLLFTITGVLKHLLGGSVYGAVSIDGVDPLAIEGFDKLPEKVGFLMQDPERQLVFPTPLDEVSTLMEIHGLEYSDAIERARNILGNLGLRGREEAHVEDLSSGERRRLSIALSILHSPRLLILDEPSANLDPEGIAMVREIVKKHRESGGAVLITEHKAHYFRDLVDRVYTLKEGGLEEGYVEEDLGMDIDRCEGGSRDLEGGDHLLEISSGVIGYPGSIVLKNVDLYVGRGEAVALIGPNGSGKTSLLKTIAGLAKLIDGDVRIYSKKIFYAPQNPDLVFTEWSVEGELRALSRRMGRAFKDLVSTYPWYDQVKRRNPLSLSHGQRRLLELLIALNHGRDLLLLDEPTTGLDPRLYAFMTSWIKRYVEKGGSLIVATHDPRLVLDIASRVYSVSGGRVREIDRCSAVKSMLKGAGIEAQA